MAFNIFMKKRSIIFNWLVSYISILLVPIAISGLIYLETEATVEKQVNNFSGGLIPFYFMALYPFLQRYFVKGVMIGSLKG